MASGSHDTMQVKATEWSGVSIADAFAIDEAPRLFDKLGDGPFLTLCTNLYNRIYADDEEWFRSMFHNTKEMAIQNLYEFFVQRMGGPSIYSDRKGHPALIARHRRFSVTHRAAEKWLNHMKQAMEETKEIDPDSKIKLMNYIRHTGYFLVAGDEMKRQNQGMPCCRRKINDQCPFQACRQ